MLVSFFSVETATYIEEVCQVEATSSGAVTATRPGQLNFRLVSRHHSQDMHVAYCSSNVIINNIIFIGMTKNMGECLCVKQ